MTKSQSMAKEGPKPEKRRPMGAEAEVRWAEILEAAGTVFYEKGYEGTSLQDIADRVGLLKGSIYYYIRTKEDLLFGLVNRALDEFAPTLQEDPDTAALSAPDRLRAFIGRWMALTAQSREWNLVAEREFRRLSPANYRAVVKRRDEASAFVQGIIRQGMDEGSFDPAVDVSIAAVAIFEVMHSTRHWHRPEKRLGLEEICEWYATFMVRGLGGPNWRALEAAERDAAPNGPSATQRAVAASS